MYHSRPSGTVKAAELLGSRPAVECCSPGQWKSGAKGGKKFGLCVEEP